MIDAVRKTLWNESHPNQDRILRPGLSFHFGCETEKEDRQCLGKVDDRIRLVMLLEGELDIRFGDCRLQLHAGHGDTRPRGTANMAMVCMQDSEEFARTIRRGRYSRRISLGLSHDWIEQSLQDGGLSYTPDHAGYLQEHLSTRQWLASPHACALAEQMLNPPPLPPELIGIYLESRALDLIIDAWSRQTADEELNRSSCPGLKQAAFLRMQELGVWLRERSTAPLTLDQIAAQVNTTASTLQRQFRMAHGVSVFEYLQRIRMSQARRALEEDGISVSQAAEIAGYTNPGSFSTAFKRHFGLSPTQVLARIRV